MHSYDKKSLKALAAARAVARAFQQEFGYTLETEKERIGACEEIIRLATLAAFGSTKIRGELEAMRQVAYLATLYLADVYPDVHQSELLEKENEKEKENA